MTADDVAPPWLLPLEHLSASSLAMAMRCPEQWRRRYIKRERERPGAALVVGSAFHQALEFNYGQKIVSHEDVPVSELLEFYGDVAWPMALDKQGGADHVVWNEGERQDAARERGKGMTALYRTEVAPRIQPLGVEVKFEVDVQLPVPVIGYVDVEREQALTEMKTSAKRLSKPKPDWQLQGRLYQWVTGKQVEWHVVSPKAVCTPLTEPELALETRAQDRIDTLVRRVALVLNHLYATYGPDDAWPGAITHPWACGFCGYRSSCRWWV